MLLEGYPPVKTWPSLDLLWKSKTIREKPEIVVVVVVAAVVELLTNDNPNWFGLLNIHDLIMINFYKVV